MHLRSGQICHFDIEVVDEASNHFENVHLGFYQPMMDCHLEVTAKNFDELFEIEANVVVGEVQQCLSPPFTWVVCSHLTFEATNYCNQS